MVWFPTVDTVAAIKKTEHIEEGGRRPFWLDVLLSIQADGMELKTSKDPLMTMESWFLKRLKFWM